MIASLLRGALLVPLCASLVGCGSGDDGSKSSGGTGGTSGDAAGSAGGDTGVAEGPVPPLPAATGTCPPFANGTATFTVNGQVRQAKIWIDDAAAAASDGPLILYWYGTAGSPDQVEVAVASVNPALGPENIAKITAKGGIVVAPVHIPNGIFPWLNTVAQDEALMDEIVACAEQQVGIDDRHIHTFGFSAGGIATATLSMDRSTYLASVVTYSGGGARSNPADPSNPFAAMIVFGGTNDQLILNFHDQSIAYHDSLVQMGNHFTFLCDHGGGHRIAPDIQGAVTEFFFDHPYGQVTSPYAAGLPADFPAYCTL